MMSYMSQPYTPPPPTVIYCVQINSEEPFQYQTPINSSKYVADNIYVGNLAQVIFENANSIEMVRKKFNERIEGWLRQVGHTAGFWCEPTATGANYRLSE
jgi:hypothetical protein